MSQLTYVIVTDGDDNHGVIHHNLTNEIKEAMVSYKNIYNGREVDAEVFFNINPDHIEYLTNGITIKAQTDDIIDIK